MTITNVEEIKEFLKGKRGYLKKGEKALKQILQSKGFQVTVKDCQKALMEVKSEFRTNRLTQGKVLIYDIETSYNIGKFWRCGYNLNINPGDIIHERKIICISYKWLGEKEVYNLAWDKNQDDKFLIEQFIEVLNESDMIVAHNGDRYDLKFIKTRALFHRLKMLVDYKQFDTLKLAKKKFMFNSNKLDYISKFLGHTGKIGTNMKLWDDIVLHKCPVAMQKMIEYCDEDVVQLEKVFNTLVHWDNPKFHAGVLNGRTKQSSPVSGSYNLEKIKVVSTTAGTKKYIMKDLDTERNFEMSETNYKKYLLIQ